MKKEQIKTITLVLLVVANLVLGSNILLDKKLWPSGYNFFNSEYFPIVGVFAKNDSGASEEHAVHLTMPKKIIFNTGDQTTRFSLNSNNDGYYEILEYCNKILVAALAADNDRITEVSDEEWFSALMTKSIYLCYYTEYETELFADFLGVKEPPLSQFAKSFSNVVISLSDNVSVYVEDFATGKYYRIKTGRRFEEFKAVAERFIDEQTGNEENTINYSFDLNFDKVFGEQKAIIASMVPIYQSTQSIPVVSVQNALLSEGKIDNDIVNKIVRIFGVNPNTARRYTEADGTIVYVENNATLKLHTNGLIDYKARDGGLLLNGSTERYTISDLNDFICSINEAAGADCDIYISSGALKDSEKITFDYVCSGIPVKIKTDDMENAVVCVASDGYITEYRHMLRSYKETDRCVTTSQYITAVDETIQKYSAVTGNITINKLYLAYNDDATAQEIGAEWWIEVEAIIIGNEEQ